MHFCLKSAGGEEQKEAASRDQIRHELEANRARERNMARAAGSTKFVLNLFFFLVFSTLQNGHSASTVLCIVYLGTVH